MKTMNKSFKRVLSLFLVLMMAMTTLVIFPLGALASSPPLEVEEDYAPVWADPENVLTQADIDSFNGGNKTSPLGAVAPFKRSASSGSSSYGQISTDEAKYYWFFPSNADLSYLTLWFNTSNTVKINGTAIESGDGTDAFASINEGGVSMEVTLEVKVGSSTTSYNVTAIKSSDVGTVYIDTNSGSIRSITTSKDNYESGTIMVVQPDGTVDYMGELEKMSGRGNGTWTPISTTERYGGEKNPYNIKLAVSTSLLGMDKAKKWCLLANAGDETLVKNQLTYDFAKYIGIKYQPTCKPVDLYVNQQYYGSYQLSEKVEIKSSRINLSQDIYENLEIANGTVDTTTGAITPADLTGTAVQTEKQTTIGQFIKRDVTGQTIGAKRYSNTLTNPADITGGYLYELEISNRWVNENAGFCAYNRQGWVIKNCDYATPDMVNYSYNLLYALGSAVYNGGTVPSGQTTTSCSRLTGTTTYGASSVTNPAPETQYQGKSWSEILDADSAVKYYWTQEYFKNMDSSTSSTYFYKDSDSVDSMLYAGPMWDMDNSIGINKNSSRWGSSWTSSTGWYTKNTRIYRWRCEDSSTSYSSDDYAPLSFYGALANNCSDFWALAEAYWYNLIEPASDILLANKTDEAGTLKSIEEYVDTVKNSGAMNAIRFNTSYNADTYKSSFRTWFIERNSWIDEQIPKSNISSAQISAIDNQYYTGREITPEPIVTYNGKTLTNGTDYTLTYENNTSVGTATVTVNGIGSYEGTKSAGFTIVKGLVNNLTVTLPSSAYVDTLIKPVIKDAEGIAVEDGIAYQWYSNGSAISGADESTFTTTSSEAGTELTLVITGDEQSFTGTAQSNVCLIAEGTKPQGYARTIAAWNYSYTNDESALVDSDGSYTYIATSGENQSSSSLTASVNASDKAELKWSGTKDIYKTDGVGDQVPIMGTSKSSGLAWGSYPYFQTEISTTGYEDIKFSGRVGATNKGPRDWKLQYSLDGINFTDVSDTTYSLSANKTMELAFDGVELPDICSNQDKVYIRMTVANDIAVSGIAIVGQLSGDAAVNDVEITGVSMAVVTELNPPTFSDDTLIFDTESISLSDNNGGADIYYSVNGAEPQLYSGGFNPFDSKTAKAGDTVTVSAYAFFNDIESETVSQTYTFAGVDINDFIYTDYSTDVNAGAVQSTGGVYDKSGKMTAYTDGTTQYVPLWNSKNGSFAVSPDDNTYWTENSGFTYCVSTAGYENITFSCKGYTTAQGPKSITLQYSTDGVNFYNVSSNVALTANKALEDVFVNAALPSACENLQKLYIRLATTEDYTFEGYPLHNNYSKGNLYINDVVISGDDDGTYKMPYTNKSTSYFGDSGLINYTSPDGLAVRYVVVDSNSNIVQSGIVPQTGIQLSTVNGFNPYSQSAYTVITQVVDDEGSSVTNSATYYYKGDTVVKFNYNGKTKLFEDYVSEDGLSVSNTSGANSGTLSMSPNGGDNALLTYTGTYGVKVEFNAENPFSANKDRRDDANASSVGYWQIETSTLGYKNLTLNLEQLSSNYGPRDWGVAYSLNGSSYTYVSGSNARAISNDASTNTVETYGNLPLPSACDNQEKLYIRIFINGGESVNGEELELATKGNTGINTIELSGISLYKDVTVNATVLENPNTDTGTIPVSGANVYVNGTSAGVTDSNGQLTVTVPASSDVTVKIGGNRITERELVISKDNPASQLNAPVIIFDVNEDGFINAKDYAIINKDSSYDNVKEYFANFINIKTSEFTYE